jgi:hypothetical protein
VANPLDLSEKPNWADPLTIRERMHLRKVLARAALAPACPHRTVREMQELHLDVTERAAVPPDHPSRRASEGRKD